MPTGRLSSELILSALLVGLMGCSGDSAPASNEVEQSPADGSELTVLLDAGTVGAWPAGLDPATNTTAGFNLTLMNAVFGGLFQLAADPEGSNPRIVGVLAEGYEITNDGRTLVIHLRDSVRFSDGTPLDAEALRFNIERNIAAPCACAPIRWPWAEENRVVIVDNLTVALNFSRPYSAAINGLPVINVNWPASPAALAAMGEDEFRVRPVGAGPFRIVSNQLSSRLELERNPHYWQAGRPLLDRLVFQSIASEQAAYLALLAGDAQVIEGVTSTAIIEQAKAEAGLTVTPQPPTAPYVIQLNTSIAPFNDARAREAIYLATDVEAIRQGLFKGWYPAAESFTGPGGLFHAAEVPGYARHDLDRARALVDEIGGVEVKLGTLQSFVAEQVVTALQSQWREAGIDVSIETVDIGSLIQALRSREWQALLQTVGSYDPESGSGVTLRFGSGQLFSGVADPALDALFADAASATDMHDRDALYTTAAKHISDNRYAPFLFAFSPTQIVTRGVSGPGLTTPIPPIAINTAVHWQDVSLHHQ